MSVFNSPLLITSAPNGAYKQRLHHHALPLTPSELASTAKECLDAGAAMVHLHIRTADGRHSLDPAVYLDATAQVRQAVGTAMVIQITSEAAQVYQPAEQIAAVQAVKPEAVSIGLREIDTPSTGEHGLAAFFGWLARERVMTQVILYDTADLRRWQELRIRGVVPDAPWSLLFVLGRYSAGQTSSPTTCCRLSSCTPAPSLGACVHLVLLNTPVPHWPPPWVAMRGWGSKTTCT